MLLFSFVGLLLLRLDEARLLELLFQLPPRKPRYEPARSGPDARRCRLSLRESCVKAVLVAFRAAKGV
jgi:hypothetical protein